MRRTLLAGLIFLAGCQGVVGPARRTCLPDAVAEPRASLPAPLPDNVTPVPYSQLLTRARTQATRATEALFVDNFADVEEAARGLEQTAKYLVKAEDVPAKHKDTLATMAGDLGKLAKELREAASSKDAEKANEILGRIN